MPLILIIEKNYQNYVINNLTCEIMENKPIRVPDVAFMNFTSGIFSSKTIFKWQNNILRTSAASE